MKKFCPENISVNFLRRSEMYSSRSPAKLVHKFLRNVEITLVFYTRIQVTATSGKNSRFGTDPSTAIVSILFLASIIANQGLRYLNPI